MGWILSRGRDKVRDERKGEPMDYAFTRAPEPNQSVERQILEGLGTLGIDKITTSEQIRTGRKLVLVDHPRGNASLVVTEPGGPDGIRHRLVVRRVYRSGAGRLSLVTAEFWRVDLSPDQLAEFGLRLREGPQRDNVDWSGEVFTKRIDAGFIKAYLDWCYSETG